MPGESVGLTDVDPTADEVTNVVISNLGGEGTYNDVVSMAPGTGMSCVDTDAACVQEVSTGFLVEPVVGSAHLHLGLIFILWRNPSLLATSCHVPAVDLSWVFCRLATGTSLYRLLLWWGLCELLRVIFR